MTGLEERLQDAVQQAQRVKRAHRAAPTGFEPGVKYEGGQPTEVTLTVAEIPPDEQAWREEIKRVTTLDLPDHRRVEILQVRYWGDPGAPQVYVRFGIRDREQARPDVDLAELVRVARGRRTWDTKRKAAPHRTRVVVISDAQVGKVDHRGGTQALLERIQGLMVGLDREMKATPCADAVILDPGDLTEGFENTAQQAFTNDLSFPEQLRHARVILSHVVTTVAGRHQATRVATVPSNHGAWRRGKDRLGRPGDDFGIETHRAVADAFALAKRDDVTFVIPEPWSESLALQVRGAVVGLAHGHTAGARPEGVPLWWAKQTHGGSPLAAATLLVSGHWHHLRVQPTGQIDGRDRWWFQAPTLDNGSSWWANSAGVGDSEPGLLTFTIDDDGRWDDLRLIRDTRAPDLEDAS